MKKRIVKLFILSLAMSVLLSGCGNGGGAQQTAAQAGAPQKDTLTIAYDTEPDSLYCFGTTKNMSEKMCANIYATLLKFDKDYNIVPYVAKSWDVSPDGMTYTFKIRNDVYFHDGKQMTVDDVVYSMEQAKASAYSSYYLESVKTVQKVDDNTVQFILNTPYSPFLNMLCEPFLGIINKESYEKLGDKFAQSPIGSGPYKVVEWIPGNKITLEAFDKFFGGKPAVKNIVIKFIPDPSTELISLENGEVDIAANISTNNMASVESNQNLKLYKTPSTNYCYMGMNSQSDKFKNQQFRKAINSAIDKEGIIQIAQDGMAAPALCTINDKTFGYPKDMKGYTYDANKAKELLTGSGASVTGFELMCKDAVTKKVAEAIQANLNKIGISVKITMMESGGYYDAIKKGNFDAFVGSWSDSLMDAASVVGMRYGSKYVGDPGNYLWLKDQTVDKLINEGTVERDKSKREKIYSDLFQYVNDQAFEVPLFYYMTNLGANKDVKGISPMTTGIYYFNSWSW